MAVPSRNIFSIFDIILTDSTVDAARRVLPNSPVCVLEAESVKIANWSRCRTLQSLERGGISEPVRSRFSRY
ncbi:uncharacterized protein N7443_009448 [Penicillium atrosanguineum]|uniref:Uncharacterized protein n=1 Tax=Penicillium atrosanguineum TaxID=1132637 RepID=A0A9W9PMZ8_9EURO|nr:uncharacterized protein N7443_009448 [Penicillium atrosanguineum]KAJ5126408.1 hypothetical protein N7526_008585 [Penicillium atrosanguineum]KAJ5293495.1 hypothetical protein N7443_009448 [Penicillium atrosanguineum]KAJ5302469.1 hypothetical protein N7476_009268 [Penicillium atrosanguineum]